MSLFKEGFSIIKSKPFFFKKIKNFFIEATKHVNKFLNINKNKENKIE